ncbi:respiratory chain complex I subunit 1 family protein [Anaeromyxobacter oryzae]|uniref:Hydrogenase n=1 Tax=Anaeromyxobacter oryzae TaxID=2918170 RepID=A0ABN6MS60_9BACT|nr:NADH-quinone oxidoreductase subunit H [Anaeromyxobacter oryzae]BDG02568.1 hydrogenase [Anaeromyxobacter oryzae]
MIRSAISFAAFLLLSPLLLGVVTRVKAIFAGRTGAPLLQPYHDLRRLLGKGAVYSRTTTWVFRAGPVVGLAAVLCAGLLLSFGGAPALLAFPGDFVLFAYLLGLGRFATALAALDTGSSFEGMGAAREVTFASYAEPALFLCLVVLASATGSLSLTGMLGDALPDVWHGQGPTLLLAAVALFGVALAENARIPFDDPTTHLELTMIHEVMVLDHSGPDLALIQYGASLKLFLLGALVVRLGLGLPLASPEASLAAFLAGMLAFAVVVGAVESTMARLRLTRVPQFLVASSVLSLLALVLLLR